MDQETRVQKINFSDGSRYEGSVLNGKANGQGTTFFDNSKYVGMHRNGFIDGIGTFYYPNISCYGNWFGNKPKNSKNIIYEYTEMVYKGDDLYNDLVPSGMKIENFKYQGEVSNDLTPDGFGKAIFSSGNKYSGKWKNGFPHGEGTFSFKDGGELEGIFIYGYPLVVKNNKKEKNKIKIIFCYSGLLRAEHLQGDKHKGFLVKKYETQDDLENIIKSDEFKKNILGEFEKNPNAKSLDFCFTGSHGLCVKDSQDLHQISISPKNISNLLNVLEGFDLNINNIHFSFLTCGGVEFYYDLDKKFTQKTFESQEIKEKLRNFQKKRIFLTFRSASKNNIVYSTFNFFNQQKGARQHFKNENRLKSRDLFYLGLNKIIPVKTREEASKLNEKDAEIHKINGGLVIPGIQKKTIRKI